MIDFFTGLPAWLLAHPWIVAGGLVLVMALGVASLLLNPDGAQLREKLRRHR